MWETGKIANVTILITNSTEHVTQSYTSHEAVQESKTIDIYTAFPYKRGNNGKGTETNAIDKWILENNGRFSRNADFHHTTTTDEFMGCPIKVFTVGPESFFIYTDKHKQEDGSILYNAGGLLIEPFLIPFLKMYFTVIFLPASLNSSIDVLLKIDNNLMEVLSVIIVGLIPVTIYVKLADTNHTIPNTVSRVRMFVPCPFREHDMSKVFSVSPYPFGFHWHLSSFLQVLPYGV
jgi:hypothetical protein